MRKGCTSETRAAKMHPSGHAAEMRSATHAAMHAATHAAMHAAAHAAMHAAAHAAAHATTMTATTTTASASTERRRRKRERCAERTRDEVFQEPVAHPNSSMTELQREISSQEEAIRRRKLRVDFK
jgi:predicted transglutaminase-like cysteine proteinase